MGARAGRLGHARQPASAAALARSCSRAARSSCASTPGYGRGHHDHVRTAGAHSKFGVPLFELDELERPRAKRGRARSSVCTRTPAAACSTSATGSEWAHCSASLAERFPRRAHRSISAAASACRRSRAQAPVDLAALGAALAELQGRATRGSSCGSSPAASWSRRPACCSRGSRSSRARATCTTSASTTGMNSLIRPALYGALSRDRQPLAGSASRRPRSYNVVGPICETGDMLGHERLLPPTAGRRRAADRERRRLRPRDELALQPARAGPEFMI